VQGVFPSTASSVIVQVVSLSTARSIYVQGVSLSTASSMDVQGVSLFEMPDCRTFRHPVSPKSGSGMNRNADAETSPVPE
jgi:hypothetical protein